MADRLGPILGSLFLLSGCQLSSEAPTAEGTLSLNVVNAEGLVSAADQGRIHVEGPTNQVVLINPGETKTIEGLLPGSYTVAVEGLLAGEVESFGERSGVTVTAGVNAQVTVVRSSFVPVLEPVDSRYLLGDALVLRWNPVTGEVAYEFEWGDNAAFSAAESARVLAREYTLLPPAAGTYYARVRSVNRFDNVGRPSETAIVHVEYPSPVISATDPSIVFAGMPGFQLIVLGANFVNASEVRWNGAMRSTAYISATELHATIPANDIETAGTVEISVYNPPPGGGISAVVLLDVMPPGLTGEWTGTYTWNCDDPGSGLYSGSTTIQMGITDSGTSFLQGTVSYLGGSAPFGGRRWRDATYDNFGIIGGTPDPEGTDVTFTWNGTAYFVNNYFSGHLSGDTISGITQNGDSPVSGSPGCSANVGPSGTFKITRTASAATETRRNN